jgi:hypothetical protein
MHLGRNRANRTTGATGAVVRSNRSGSARNKVTCFFTWLTRSPSRSERGSSWRRLHTPMEDGWVNWVYLGHTRNSNVFHWLPCQRWPNGHSSSFLAAVLVDVVDIGIHVDILIICWWRAWSGGCWWPGCCATCLSGGLVISACLGAFGSAWKSNVKATLLPPSQEILL